MGGGAVGVFTLSVKEPAQAASARQQRRAALRTGRQRPRLGGDDGGDAEGGERAAYEAAREVKRALHDRFRLRPGGRARQTRQVPESVVCQHIHPLATDVSVDEPSPPRRAL